MFGYDYGRQRRSKSLADPLPQMFELRFAHRTVKELCIGESDGHDFPSRGRGLLDIDLGVDAQPLEASVQGSRPVDNHLYDVRQRAEVSLALRRPGSTDVPQDPRTGAKIAVITRRSVVHMLSAKSER